MLAKFTVENYKNFKDEISIDFSSTHDYKFNNNCIKNGLINKMVVYGPNASGKTNFGYALFDIVSVLTDKQTESLQRDAASFKNADSNIDEASFRYVFRKNKDEITYEYRKSSPVTLTYETLLINDVAVYTCDYNTGNKTFYNLEAINAENLNFEYLGNDFAVLRYIAYNTIQPEDSVVRFIMNFVSHMLYFKSDQKNEYIGLMSGNANLNSWIAGNRLNKEFEHFLRELAGINIDIDIIYNNQQVPILVEKHKNANFIFEMIASSGTKALELLFYWSRSLKDVSFLYMDEFDAFYHYDLARKVLEYIVNYENAQTIFTTHNSYLASNEILRPDCYYVLQNGRFSSFVDSTDREIREGHNLEKMLRNGEFDA